MNTGVTRNGVSSDGNEGTVGNVEKNTVMRTDQVAEERDLVGVYLHEISRTPLLDAAREVELSKAIEGGLYAEHLLETGEERRGVSRAQIALAWVSRQPTVDAPIIGATKPGHIDDAVASLDIELTDDEVAELESPYSPRPIAGFA
jgi:aryl-alcohol dehydrogenase-like predicted oxidoreductase